MFVLGSEIKIGNNLFSRVHSVKIESSAKTLEDTAIIKLPTTARLQRQGEFVTEVETAKVFNPGDPVTIKLGYDGNLVTEFIGFVRKIKPTTPLEVHCEDATYRLKRKPLNKSFKGKDLGFLLNYLLEGTGIELTENVPSISFTTFYFLNTSAAKALQEFKDKYGLTIYFKSPTELFVGLAFDNDSTTVKYKFGYNVIDNDLEWVTEDEVKLKIKAIHIKKNNQKIVEEVGDSDGEVRTLYFYDLEKGEDLKKRATEEILKYKYSGYKGGLNGFLVPKVNVGNVVELIDEQYTERDGKYIVDKVVTTFGPEGGRRKVSLGLKI